MRGYGVPWALLLGLLSAGFASACGDEEVTSNDGAESGGIGNTTGGRTQQEPAGTGGTASGGDGPGQAGSGPGIAGSGGSENVGGAASAGEAGAPAGSEDPSGSGGAQGSASISSLVFRGFTQSQAKGWACLLRSDSTVACWGINASKETTPPSGKFTRLAISTAAPLVCGHRDDGKVQCWGDGDVCTGGIGEGNVGTCHDYVPSPDTTYLDFDVSGEACGITADGAIDCWVSPDADLPVGDFRKIDLGDFGFGCAIDRGGALSCWGLSDGATPPPDGEFTDVSLGFDYGCALDTAHHVKCWGAELQSTIDGPVVPEPEDELTMISVDEQYGCGIRRVDQTLACWGEDFLNHGYLVPPKGTFTTVTMRVRGGCAIDTAGALQCWGEGNPKPEMIRVPEMDLIPPVDLSSRDCSAIEMCCSTLIAYGIAAGSTLGMCENLALIPAASCATGAENLPDVLEEHDIPPICFLP